MDVDELVEPRNWFGCCCNDMFFFFGNEVVGRDAGRKLIIDCSLGAPGRWGCCLWTLLLGGAGGTKLSGCETPQFSPLRLRDAPPEKMKPVSTQALRALRRGQLQFATPSSSGWTCMSCHRPRRIVQCRWGSTSSADATKAKPYYITTPIFYVNAGNTYTTTHTLYLC